MLVNNLLSDMRQNKVFDLDHPSRDDASGEWDYDTGNENMAKARFWLDNYSAMGFPIDEMAFNDSVTPLEEFPNQMDDSALFPAPDKTVNADTAVKGAPFLTPEQAASRLAEWKAQAAAVGENFDNSNKVIFSLFDYTGQWSQPFVDAGFNVIRHDIKLGEDILTNEFIWNRLQEIREAGFEVYGVMSACPCTTFSGAGARWRKDLHDLESPEALAKVFGERALSSGAKSALEYNQMLVQATKDFIKAANPTGFHVLENPIGRIKEKGGLPDPTMRFNPNVYGDAYTKRTQLWGAFDTDLPTAYVEPIDGSKMQSKLRGDDALSKEERSITPEGFSYAFFMANAPDGQVGEAREKLVEEGVPISNPDTGAQRSLEDIDLDVDVTVVDGATEEEMTVTMTAEAALDRIDKRIRGIHALRKCLTG